MKKFKKVLTVTLIFLLSAALYASEGGQGIPILDLGVGGKASAMGGAFISISDDATAILWNPAGMVQIDGDELTLSYAGLSGFLSQLAFVGYARNFGKVFTAGLGFKMLFSGTFDDEVTTGQRSKFTEGHFMFIFSGAFNLPFPLKPGFSIKYAYQNLNVDDYTGAENYSAGFFNIDIGVLYPIGNFLNLGLKIENLIPSINMGIGDANEPVPTKIITGASVKLFDGKFRFAMDMEMVPANGIMDLHIGVEYRLMKSFSVYGGIDKGSLTFGANLYVGDFSVYSTFLLNPGYDSTTRLALHYKMGKSKRKYKSIERQMIDLSKGLEKFHKGKYRDAQKFFKKVLDEDPKNRTAKHMVGLAKTRIESKDWLKPEEKLFIKKQFKIAKDFYDVKNWADSRDGFNKILGINPLHWASKDYIDKIDQIIKDQVKRNFRFGVKYFIQNNLKKAKPYLREVVRLKKDHRQAFDLLERIKLIEKDAWERKIKEDMRMNNAQIYYKRGILLFKKANYIDAIQSLKLSLNYVDNRLTRYYKELAEKRLKKLNISKKSRVKSIEFYKLGNQLSNAKKYKDAIKAFEKAVNYFPQNKTAEKALSDARALFRKILEKPFKEGLAFFKKGNYLKALNKWRDALKIDKDYEPAKKYIKSTKKEMRVRSMYNLQIADTHYKRGTEKDLEEALKYYKNAYDLNRNNVKALRGWRKIKGIFKNKSMALFNKGFDALKSNKLSKLNIAIDSFEKYLLIRPDDKQAKQFLADARRRKNANRTQFRVNDLNNEAKALFTNRDYAKAKVKFQEILKYEPNNRTVKKFIKRCIDRIKLIGRRQQVMKIFNEGIRHFKKRRYKKAIKVWSRVERMKVASVSDKKMLKGYIQTAKEVWKYNQNKFYIKGFRYAKMNMLLKASESLKEALKINKYHNKARRLLTDVSDRIRSHAFKMYKSGLNSYKAGNYKKSVKTMEESLLYRRTDKTVNILEDSKENLKLFIQAENLFKKGKYIDASIKYEQILRNNRLDKKVKQKIVRVSQKLSEKTDSLVMKAEKQIKNKAYSDALLTLEIVLKSVKFKKDKKKRAFIKDRAITLKKRAGKKLGETLRNNYSAGYRLYIRKVYNKALVYFNRVVKYKRDYKNVRRYRLKCIRIIGVAKRARAQKNAGAIQRLLFLGMSRYRAGKYQAAINAWMGILRIVPNHSGARSYIARARFKMGR
ncbi:MAG: tetratricopeptide repeat protein [Spirochaetes bacterium]|nr:tetratricopeptide repeat protein [Spirochaetota bacterium]